MSRGIIYFLTLFFMGIFIVPVTVVTLLSTTEAPWVLAEDQIFSYGALPTVPVYLTSEKKIIRIPLESYVKGVVAAEMPADFHVEALKAQAMSARTYIMDRIKRGNFKDMSKFGSLAKEAMVTDSIGHQVYYPDKILRKKWGKEYTEKMNRIVEAVKQTKGKIITYQGKPIYAAFFSTSNGRTENSEDYFHQKYPYLRSVDSKWDVSSPEYKKEYVMGIPEVIQVLQGSTGKRVAMTTSKGPLFRVLDRSEGNRILRMKVGDQVFSGREIRMALGLPSSDFSIKTTKKTIAFVSRGYGHGVGMSQWGANLMAKEGKKAEDIIHHYYQGVHIDYVK